MDKTINVALTVLVGLVMTLAAAGCGTSEVKAASPNSLDKERAAAIAPGLYYSELPTGFRLATNYLELDSSSIEVLRGMAANDPERSQLLLQEADHLEAGLGLVEKAGGAKAVAAGKGISQGQTLLTNCAYQLKAVPYDTYKPGSNDDGAYAYADLNCEHGLPVVIEKEIVSAEVVIDGVKKAASVNGLPYDNKKTSASQSNLFPQGEILHSCSSSARVQVTVLSSGLELPSEEVSEHNHRCRDLISL